MSAASRSSRPAVEYVERYRAYIDLFIELTLAETDGDGQSTSPQGLTEVQHILAQALARQNRQISEIPLKDVDFSACSPPLLDLCAKILEYRNHQYQLEAFRVHERAALLLPARFPWFKTPVSSILSASSSSSGSAVDETATRPKTSLAELYKEICSTDQSQRSVSPSEYVLEQLPRVATARRHPDVVFATIPRLAQLAVKISDPDDVAGIEHVRIDHISVLGIDEADSDDAASVWRESRHHVFRRVTQHAYELVSMFSHNKPFKRLLQWFLCFRSLFTDKCRVCGHLLAFDSPATGFLPPCFRGFQKMNEAFHTVCIQPTDERHPLPACRLPSVEKRKLITLQQQRAQAQMARQQQQLVQLAHQKQLEHQTQLLNQLQAQDS